jgi:hypothetical protein
MKRAIAILVLALGCQSQEPARLGAEPAARAGEEESQTFGRAPNAELPVTPLSAILADPEGYRDRVVRTEGTIAQVCQRMGCWMELRQGEDGPAVRVPMAGHSFFLPRDVAGRQAMLEGRVALADLSPSHRAHLEGEGATATGSALSIEATGVVVR